MVLIKDSLKFITLKSLQNSPEDFIGTQNDATLQLKCILILSSIQEWMIKKKHYCLSPKSIEQII